MIPNFKAWASGEKLMSDVEYINFASETVVLTDTMDCFHIADVELMQSTGLKDKNGVEIFEGDIVKIIGDVLNDGMSVIRFVQGGFYLDYKNLDTEFELLYSVDLPIEVIGNIYEDKELLEVEQ